MYKIQSKSEFRFQIINREFIEIELETIDNL